MNTHVHPLHATYVEQRRAGNLVAAAGTLKTVLKNDPHADWAYNELIEMLYAAGRRADAETLSRTALRVNPANARAHSLFGALLSEANDLPAGEWHFRRALQLGGEQPAFLVNLAQNLARQGRTEEGDVHFARAHALDPGDFRTLAHWSKLCEISGDLPRALGLLDQAARASSQTQVDLLRANLLARAGRSAEALEILDASRQLNGDARLLRGRLLERSARYEEAWREFTAGKEQLAREMGGASYDRMALETLFARMERFFVRANIELLPRAPLRAGAPQPIFIMGAPRSGTTLIEQVLCSHSAVRPGGELTFIAELREFSLQHLPGPEPFPENLWRAWMADRHTLATLLRDYYFARAEQYGLLAPGKAFFTDKMPFNEIWLPLIAIAFPNAAIIRVVRHPLDVCVSMMANNLTHGFNCGYRIADIVHHLAAVHTLVGCYEQEMRINSFTLRYETFVEDQAAQTQRLLDFIGLPFESACLRFHENRRHAPTPSYAQVTEQLNSRSIGKYRHYAAQLEPSLPPLRAVMSAHGYAA